MPRLWRFTPLWVLALLAALLAVAVAPAQAATTSITVDGAQGGRTFDGIGAISGGGGNSRLLTDYPAAQQSQILDYLFKPGYGANLQLLKLEIGGDANSTDGSEPSIEHSKGTVNCDAGYEFWLARAGQGSATPDIGLYGLAWAAPGWINGGFWSTDTINYLISWLGCAKQHGLDIKLPRRLERARPRRRLVRPAALRPRRGRLLRRAARRRRQRLGRGRRHGQGPGVQRRGVDHRRALLVRGR